MRILITGSGTLAKEIVRQLGEQERIVIFSRSEFNQSEMRKEFPEGGASGLRYFIGNVRDLGRLVVALQNIDVVIHTAAMKQINTCEYNPAECVKTNIGGCNNVINACCVRGVKKCLFISTDKAVNPTTLYGMSKACAERLFISGNNNGTCRLAVVRYGNVLASRGSVIDVWKAQAAKGQPLTVTDYKATRFFWQIKEAASFVIDRIPDMEGGEIYIPKMCKFKIINMALEISRNTIETGLRPAEKLHESLLTQEETKSCYDRGAYYVLYPAFHDWRKSFPKKGTKTPNNIRLNSEAKNDEITLSP